MAGLSMDTFEEFLNRQPPDRLDLQNLTFLSPWGVMGTILAIIERERSLKKPVQVNLPVSPDVRQYLKRMRVDQFLKEIGYGQTVVEGLAQSSSTENDRESQLVEVSFSHDRGQWQGRLHRIRKVMEGAGMTSDDTSLIEVMLAELANNCFDHNAGNWPTSVAGCFVMAQRYRNPTIVEVAVADVGVGFLGSLRRAYPALQNDQEALKNGLSGFTGRVPEQRGNGLKFVRKNVLGRYHGSFQVRSNGALAKVIDPEPVITPITPLTGTLAGFRIELS